MDGAVRREGGPKRAIRMIASEGKSTGARQRQETPKGVSCHLAGSRGFEAVARFDERAEGHRAKDGAVRREGGPEGRSRTLSPGGQIHGSPSVGGIVHHPNDPVSRRPLRPEGAQAGGSMS